MLQYANNTEITLGWREWLSLPELSIQRIKAKIDTGARTSALHAFRVETFIEQGSTKVKFDIHPRQYSTERVIHCVADLLDIRWVTDSGGHREQRYVICTTLAMSGESWPIELTLTKRDDMRFRMLLGRSAMHDKNIKINPSASYLLNKINKNCD